MEIANAAPPEAGAAAASARAAERPKLFQEIVLDMGLKALAAQDAQFEKAFAQARERVQEMTLVNDCIQMVNTYKSSFNEDGKAQGDYKESDDSVRFSYADARDWETRYYPQLVQSGKIKDGQGGTLGIGSDSLFTSRELDSFLENARAYQSTLSSKNEQQMLITNNAASRRTSVFQQMQTLMSSAKEALQSASR